QHLPERGALLPHAAPSPAGLKVRLARLGKLLAAADPGPVTTELTGRLRTLDQRLRAMPAEEAASRLLLLEQLMARDPAEDLYRLRDVSTPQPITLDDLPPSLRERYVGQNGKWLLQVFGKECLWDFTPLEEFVDQVRAVDPDATGKPFSTLAGLVAMKKGF